MLQTFLALILLLGNNETMNHLMYIRQILVVPRCPLGSWILAHWCSPCLGCLNVMLAAHDFLSFLYLIGLKPSLTSTLFWPGPLKKDPIVQMVFVFFVTRKKM